jgi:hypothetical protein
MKTLRFVFVCCYAALVCALRGAEPSNNASAPPSGNSSQSAGDRLSGVGDASQIQGGPGPSDGRSAREKQRRTPGSAGTGHSGVTLPRPKTVVKPALSSREHPAAKRDGMAPNGNASVIAASPHQNALSQSPAAAKDGPAHNVLQTPHSPAVSSPPARPAALPISPAHGPGSAPASLGGSATAATRNTAVLNGTGLKHAP